MLVGEKKKKTRADLNQIVDANYYGFRDDEDGKLEQLERVAEEAAIAAAVKEWEQATGKRRRTDDEDEDEKELSGANVFVVPSTEAIERALLERRKQVIPLLITFVDLPSSFLLTNSICASQDLMRKYATSH